MSTPPSEEAAHPNEMERLRARIAELERERQVPSEIVAESNEALRESEAVLRSLFDSPEVMRGIIELVDGVIVHVSCNQAAAKMFGVDQASIAGKSATAAGASDEVAQKWVGLYQESRRTGKPVSGEYARRDADGRQRWLLATASYLGQGRSGNPRFAYTILDLTDRKRAEEALRESEERFRAQVMASSDVVYRMNPDWSDIRQLRGRDFIPDTEAPSGAWLQKYIHPDDQPRVLAAIDKAIRTKSIFELEHRVLRVDGALGWTFSRAIPLLDANREIVEWLGAASDITAGKLAEEALNKQRQLLEVTLQSIGDAVLTTDAGGKITLLNPVAARLTGWAAEEALGRQARDVLRTIDEQTRESAEDMVARVLREGRVIAMANHTVLVARDGREIPIEDSAAPIHNNGVMTDDDIIQLIENFAFDAGPVVAERRNRGFTLIHAETGVPIARHPSRFTFFVSSATCHLSPFSRLVSSSLPTVLMFRSLSTDNAVFGSLNRNSSSACPLLVRPVSE